jgi:Translation initiation factor IF-2, N-terminal region
MRVYALARELNVTGDAVLAAAERLGFGLKNQLSSLNKEQCDAIKKELRMPPFDLGESTGVGSKLPPPPPTFSATAKAKPTD